MRIFGTILPYIGFDSYVIDNPGDGTDLYIKVLEVGWFNYYIEFAYSVDVYNEDLHG